MTTSTSTLNMVIDGLSLKFYTPERLAELQAAFNRVAPVDNWKTAIDTTLPGTLSMTDIFLIRAAVTWFTGSVASFEYLPSGEIRVTAAGYYAAIGA